MTRTFRHLTAMALLCLMSVTAAGDDPPRAMWAGKAGKGFVVTDGSGGGCHLTLGDKRADLAPTRIMGFLDFNGLTDYATPGAHPRLQDYTSGLTVLAWTWPHAQNLVRPRYVVHQDMRIGLGLDAHDRPTGAIRPDGWKAVTADQPMPLDGWGHLALTYDGKAMRLFLNASQVGQSEADGPISSSGSRPLYLGRCAYADDNYWCGLIGTVEIYGRALTVDEIRARMSATKPRTPVASYRLKAARVDQPFIANGGFERLSGAPFTIAGAWRSNTWGENTSTFSEETRDVHSGDSCQRIEVTSFTDGGVVLCQLGGPRLLADTRYKLELWMKGNESAGDAAVSVRTMDGWRPTGLDRTFPVTTEWRKYRLIGKLDHDLVANVAVSLKPRRAGILWVDDVTITPMD